MPGAQLEILVDATPRSYRVAKDIAIVSAEFLKHRKPQSEVKVKDLQSGDVTVVAYKPDAGRCSSHYQAAEELGQGTPRPFLAEDWGFGVWQRRLFRPA